jgi:hypothetical protein
LICLSLVDNSFFKKKKLIFKKRIKILQEFESKNVRKDEFRDRIEQLIIGKKRRDVDDNNIINDSSSISTAGFVSGNYLTEGICKFLGK